MDRSPKNATNVKIHLLKQANKRTHLKNTQWRKVKQIQSVWLCIFSNMQFQNILKKIQWTKVKKCNLCENAFSYTGALRTHLKTHSGYKSNKCNQCDFDLLKQAISEHIEKHTMDKSQTNVINVKMYLLKQAN